MAKGLIEFKDFTVEGWTAFTPAPLGPNPAGAQSYADLTRDALGDHAG